MKGELIRCHFTKEELEQLLQAINICENLKHTVLPNLRRAGLILDGLASDSIPTNWSMVGKMLSYCKKAEK